MPGQIIPYPASPTDYPDDLTKPGHESTARGVLVLIGVFAFLGAYFALILACMSVVFVVTTRLGEQSYPLLWIMAAIVATAFALLLVKGLFVTGAPDKTMHVEVFLDDHPLLYGFIEKLTDEIGAPMPHRVFITPEVTAAALQELTLLNLVVPPKKNLLVGLGLINVLNLSEFKAVLAHEFGHFSQTTTRLNAYLYVAFRIIHNLVEGEDWLDRIIRDAWKNSNSQGGEGVAALCILAFVGVPVWLTRKTLFAVAYLLNLAALSLSRQQEFHADRVAVSVSGSNAIVHSLAKIDFASKSLHQAVQDLETASQHDLYSNDLFAHQLAAAERARKKKNKPRLGLPPLLKRPEDGKKIQVFDDNDPEEDDVPIMWSSHPRNFDREENAKEIFVVAPDDDRSPWVLFRDPEDVREMATYKFYRVVFNVKKSVKLSPAQKVLEFIDDEYAEITYDKKYHGAYDGRWINPGEPKDLNRLVTTEPWDRDRITRVHGRLYLELGDRSADNKSLIKRIRKIFRRSYGRPRGRDKRELEDTLDDLKALNDWFASFDRRVYLCYANMASQVGGMWLRELTHRYNFHLSAQDIQRELSESMDRVEDVLEGLFHYGNELPPDYFEEVNAILGRGRKTLIKCLDVAKQLKTPAMANVEEGARFERLIFDQKVLKETYSTMIRSNWIIKLLNQMGTMKHRVDRMVFKSMGAILIAQDRLAREWFEQCLPDAEIHEELPEIEVLGDAPQTKPD